MNHWILACFGALALSWITPVVAADQVEMRNGDRYVGKVISLDSNTLVIQNDVLGTVKLPRSRVSVVSLGSVAGRNETRPEGLTNLAAASHSTVLTNLPPDSPAVLNQLTNRGGSLTAQSPAQLLEGAGPEAKAKFNELMTGLLSGKLSMGDLRAEAKSMADQVRAMRSDLGEEAASSLDTYLAILDKFVKESAPAAKPAPSPEKVPESAK